MMSFYTKKYFSNYYKERSHVFDFQLREARRYSEGYDIFLSHSNLDREIILGIWMYLESKGLKVYVYWIDDQDLDSEEVNKVNAERIRKRMKVSKSLIYASSKGAENSKWMTWELGFMDGRTQSKCAILPLVDREGESFEGKEFMSLYPTVSKEGIGFNSKPIIFDGKQRHYSLKNWIN